MKVTDNAGNIAYSKTFVQGSSITGIGVGANVAGSKVVNGRTFSVYGTGPEGATVTLKRRATAGSGAYSTLTLVLLRFPPVLGLFRLP